MRRVLQGVKYTLLHLQQAFDHTHENWHLRILVLGIIWGWSWGCRGDGRGVVVGVVVGMVVGVVVVVGLKESEKIRNHHWKILFSEKW